MIYKYLGIRHIDIIEMACGSISIWVSAKKKNNNKYSHLYQYNIRYLITFVIVCLIEKKTQLSDV